MEIIRIETGFAIKLPFDLKDSFRATFPSAKWNPSSKQWEVGPRSGKRLRQWAVAAADVAQAIEERDQQELTAAELEQLRSELVELERKVRDTIASRVAIAQLASEIQAAGEKLNAVRAEVKAAEDAANAEKQRVDGLLAGVIDLPGIKRSTDKMASNMGCVSRSGKAWFAEAKEFVLVQRELLLRAGWRCRAIEKLAAASIDRALDSPRYIPASDWYDLWPAQREED